MFANTYLNNSPSQLDFASPSEKGSLSGLLTQSLTSHYTLLKTLLPFMPFQIWVKISDSCKKIQSGASSLAKQGGAYFSAVCGSIQDPIAAPGPHETQEP